MVVCRFFQQGTCKFGDNCRNEHPGAGGGNPFGSQNRFGALSNQQQNNYQNQTGRNAFRTGQSNSTPSRLPGVDVDTIRLDLTSDKPMWPFSVYGPGRNAPKQLLEGAVEQSFEEVRLRYYAAMQSGNVLSAQQAEEQEFQKVQAQIQKVLNDLDGAVRYVTDGEKEHPNRIDLCNQSTPQQAQQTPVANPFNTTQATSSGLQQPRATFGAPSFGQPSNPQPIPGASSFGQPSAFGAPSALGSNQNTAFGRPSGMGQTSTFGQPAFGQPSTPAQNTAFGQTSTPTQTPAFGQPSFQAKSSPFGQAPSFTQQGSSTPTPAFGQPSFGTTQSPFAAQNTATGQANQPPLQNPFKPIANSGSAINQPMAAGAPMAAVLSPFVQTTQQSPQPFATATINQGVNGTTFGQPSSQVNASSNPFAKASPAPIVSQSPQMANGVAVNGFSNMSSGAAADIKRDPRSNAIISFNGHPVKYVETTAFYLRKPSDPKSAERIWFPDGPPQPNPYTVATSDAYNKDVAETYKYALSNGAFKDNIMPEIPPQWDMNVWAI